jgi:methyl-accepting chemotaxis protein
MKASNWGRMSVSKKISFGFGAVLMLLVVLGILSYAGVGSIVGNARQVIDGNGLDSLLAQKEIDHLNWAGKINALLTDRNITALKVETDHHKCAFGRWLYGDGRHNAETLVPTLAPLLKQIETPHQQLHATAIAIAEKFKQADPHLPTLVTEKKVDHLMWAGKIRDALLNHATTLEVETDPTRCALGKFINSATAKEAVKNGSAEFKQSWEAMLTKHRQLHKSALNIQKALQVSQEKAKSVFDDETQPLLNDTLVQLETLKSNANKALSGMSAAGEIYATQTTPLLHQTQKLLSGIRSEAKKNILSDTAMLKAAKATRSSVSIVTFVAIAVGAILAFLIARGLVNGLTQIISQINESAGQVAAASSQISSSSQTLAEGASEQAASIEETSSSLEEMSAMTSQNADNAGQADGLMKNANKTISEANEAMNALTGSMDEISKASEKTSKIIGTIDEIAFQTNLLALNAAVEAARAGEVGAGFAVVADEVRNLALRAAEAAKNTADLIEGTVHKVKDGAELVARTNAAFVKVAEGGTKVGELIGEISAASNEQAQGIEQVNSAVSEMDKVTQRVAATSEESASASEEMNGQAEEMREMVLGLTTLVRGQNAKIKSNGTTIAKATKTPTKTTIIQQSARSGNQNPRNLHQVTPHQTIPMDDHELKDF